MKLEIFLDKITHEFNPPPTNFLQFEALLVDTFHLVSLKDSEIKYQDLENDMIVISNNEEYTYMLNTFKAKNLETILIFINKKSQILTWNSSLIKDGCFFFKFYKICSKAFPVEENIKEIDVIPFDNSMNLDPNDNPRNFFKEKIPKKMAHFKEEEEIDLRMPILGKKESSFNIESKIPYSEIPCIKCKGKGKKNDEKTCKKCDGSGRMKNNKKLKKIEYVIEKKLQALLLELEKRKCKLDSKPEISIDKALRPSSDIKIPAKGLGASLPLFFQSETTQQNNLNPSPTTTMVHKGFRCNGCKIPIVGFRFHCIDCPNFDFCEKCENSQPHPHAFIKVRRLVDEPRSSNLSTLNQSQSLMIETSKEYKVQIFNVSNNISAMVKKTYTNSISIKNSGNTKWPDNTELKCVSGLHKDTSEGIPSLNPLEEYKVNLVLQAPNNPGTYACSWRLSYRIKNDTCFFGQKIDFNVNVEEDPAELEKMYLEKARELKKKVEGKDGGHLANYVDVVKKYEKYSIQELYQKIMEKAKNKKEL